MPNIIGYSVKPVLPPVLMSKGQYTTPTYVNMHRGRKILLGLLFNDTKQPNDNNFVTNIESQKFDRLLALMSKGQYTTPHVQITARAALFVYLCQFLLQIKIWTFPYSEKQFLALNFHSTPSYTQMKMPNKNFENLATLRGCQKSENPILSPKPNYFFRSRIAKPEKNNFEPFRHHIGTKKWTQSQGQYTTPLVYLG